MFNRISQPPVLRLATFTCAILILPNYAGIDGHAQRVYSLLRSSPVTSDIASRLPHATMNVS